MHTMRGEKNVTPEEEEKKQERSEEGKKEQRQGGPSSIHRDNRDTQRLGITVPRILVHAGLRIPN